MAVSDHPASPTWKGEIPLIAQPMVRAYQNDGSRYAFHDGNMQEMRWSAFNCCLLDPGMRPHSLGEKRRADFMEPHAGLQGEPLQHLHLRHLVNTLHFYFVNFQPALENRPHLSREHGQPPSQHPKPDDPLPHTPETSSPRDEFLLPRLLPFLRDLTGTSA